MREPSGKENPVIRVRNLSKKYYIGQYSRESFRRERQERRQGSLPEASAAPEIYALEDISFEVYQGEAFGIIGRNGAGKSTLLKILCEITAPTSGSVEISGRISSMLEVGTGFDPEMTGRENIYLNGTILGMSRAEINEKLADIIEFSEIGEFIDTPVKRYSKGMYAKLAFSVAAFLENEIMILDEVLAVGDLAFREKSVAKMKSKAAEGRTVLYVGHNMNYLSKLCDRCMVLDQGKMVFSGDTEDAVQYYMTNIIEEAESRQRAEEEKKARETAERTGKAFVSPENKAIESAMKGITGGRRDVREKERSRLLPEHRLHLNEVEYVGKDDLVFVRGEEMKMTLRWSVLEDYQDLCLQIGVSTMSGEYLASYILDGIGDGKAGEEKEYTVRVDVSCFTAGTYKFIQTFFFRDGDRIISTDRVIGLVFELRDEEPQGWMKGKWGHLRLSGIEAVPPDMTGSPVNPF